MSSVNQSSGVELAGSPRRMGAAANPSFADTLQQLLQQNVREYGMYFALFVVALFFTFTTHGLFISSRNISNLINQTGYIAVLAVGMTLIIIIKHIDLSVGFLAGFLGAVAAIALKYWGLPVLAVIPMILALGVLAGLVSGFLVAQLRIPAFVATLAGWLGYRGLLQWVTAGTGTVIVSDNFFNAISNDFIPDIPNIGILPGVHKVTLILGFLAIVLFIVGQVNDRRKTQAQNFEVLPMNLFILKLVFVSALLGGITWILAGYQGLSWTAVVILIVVLFYNFVMTNTVTGRHIYALGGNPQAAALSGINVKWLTFLVFASMGMLAALSGILYTSRLRSATTIAGTLFELDAIAAAFVGGAAVAGGVGSVVGSIIGALLYASLTNGMNLMGLDISVQYIVRALVLAGAVIFDVAARRREQ